MIQFNNLNQETPYLVFKEKYNESLNAKQKNIEAICISSFNREISEVDSRYVNLKYVNKDEFIFFSNYNSPKAQQFKTHNQITAVFYWTSINVQIRMKAKIKKRLMNLIKTIFLIDQKKKNALAISSNQSKPINSYNQVKENYNISLKK